MSAARRLYLIGYGLMFVISVLGEIIWLGDPVRFGTYYWIDQIEWLFKLLAVVPLLWVAGAWQSYRHTGRNKRRLRLSIQLLTVVLSLLAGFFILLYSHELTPIGISVGAAWLLTMSDLLLGEWAERRHWIRNSIIRLAVFAAAAAVLFWPTPYQVITPGFTINMNRYAHVEGGAAKGSIEGVLVIERPAFPVDWLFARMFKHIAVEKRDMSQSIGEQLEAAHSQRVGANEIGSAVAFQKAGIGKGVLPAGVYVLAIMKDSPASGALKAGDQILSVNDQDVASSAELANEMNNVKPGDTVSLSINRSGKKQVLDVPTKASADQPDRAVFGIQIEDRVHADLPRDVDYRSYLVYQGGPSHGAILALTLIDQLTPGGVTFGHRVAGTGTISADGTVGIIGGIEQKAYAVWRSKADVFFVPAEQAVEARRGAPDLNIIPVRTLDEMLNWLRTHAK